MPKGGESRKNRKSSIKKKVEEKEILRLFGEE